VKQLSQKRELFVEYYLEDLNAARAARKAGYSERTARQQGYELLTKPDIQVRIREGYQAKLSKAKKEAAEAVLSREEVLQEDSWIATSNLFDLIERVTSSGILWKDLSSLPPEVQRCVQELQIDPDKGAVKVKLHSKHPSLERLAKHHRIFNSQAPMAEEVSPETVPAMAKRAATWLRLMCAKFKREPAQMTVAEVIDLLEHPPGNREHAPEATTRSGGMLSDPRAETRTLREREMDDGETD